MSENNWTCQTCGIELVEASKTYLLSIKDKVSIKSLPKNWEKRKKDLIKICPRCDAYALGSEFIEGPPLRDKTGKITTIQDLEHIIFKHD